MTSRIIQGLKQAVRYAGGDKSQGRSTTVRVGASTLVKISRKDFDKFADTLVKPPEPNEHLRKLLHSKAPWEKQKDRE